MYYNLFLVLIFFNSYLSANEPLVAAKTIASTSEPNYVRAAAYICRKFNLDKEADEYRFVCLEKCFMKYDYSALKQLIQQEPCMQVIVSDFTCLCFLIFTTKFYISKKTLIGECHRQDVEKLK